MHTSRTDFDLQTNSVGSVKNAVCLRNVKNQQTTHSIRHLVSISSRRVNSYSSNNDKHHTRIMCGLTPYIACLSPISMSRAVSCLLSCRHSTAALRDSITILAWFCSNSSFKKTSPETSLVISFVNNFFKWWFCENNLKNVIILCLLVSSLISFANSLDSDQDRHPVGPDLDPNWLTLL